MDKEPKKKAVALKYNKDMQVPKVIAKGKGYVAENIIKTGKRDNIKIQKDENTVNGLMDVDIGEEIPYELYDAVAEIIHFVYLIDREKGEENEE